MKYIWQQDNWPEFQYDLTGIQEKMIRFTEKTGRVDGLLSALPESLRMDAVIELMVAEAVKSSEIEGEMLSRPDVMSSIKNNLGIPSRPRHVSDSRARGIAELMVCVRDDFARALSRNMLFTWHSMLMKGNAYVKSGAWRSHSEPMLIVSGTVGSEQVHYEAPPSPQVPGEMKRFVEWFNATAPRAQDEICYAPVRSALAHLYFESIHPFEDGNGRIGRALSEKVLSQGLGRPVVMSLSRSIDEDRQGYYDTLKQAQQAGRITEWIEWFVNMLMNAQTQAETEIEFTLKKTRLFDRVEGELNARQLKAVRRMLAQGAAGFEGGMTAKKYMAITKATKPTATRDLQDLVAKTVLIPEGSGRSTHYQVNI
ncbi:Adenosine monophosphate-protein transferase SoFic [Pontiella desulfatans]|uniref:Adenosine monophosphate-protein transferase SoFic n=1 Tax=Pontiella desulfatans TaxID=2750659 RepID=A0A6C2U6M5_PONDE|nr:Fic family protein [Pontiella desulfatans]VGO15722.1 Adenosine monophosphate-protein transferase SoFic [Pontiella desulfatans]